MTALAKRARCCPVCWQTVTPTPKSRKVFTHLDSLGRTKCPMSGHDFNQCYPLTVDPKLRGAA